MGWYEPRIPSSPTTTRQAEVLNLVRVSPPTTHRGLIIGVEQSSGQLACHDPFDGPTPSPNVAVVGDSGQDKGALFKTWGLLRQLVLGRRRVVVLDTTGGYSAVTAALGAPSISLRPGGDRLNLLDPAIRLEDVLGAPGQRTLLRAVLAEALGRPVSEREDKALRLALLAATRGADNRRHVPVLADVVHHLLTPAAESADESCVPLDELRSWGVDAAFALERMIAEELAGLADAGTTPGVRLDHSSGLTHFDLSALPPTGPALRVMTALISTWQLNLLARCTSEAGQTVNLVEDGRRATAGPAGGVFLRNAKVTRDVGTFAGFDHVSDLPDRSFLAEAGTVFLFRQALRTDAETCGRLYRLSPRSIETIMQLDRVTCLLKTSAAAPPAGPAHLPAQGATADPTELKGTMMITFSCYIFSLRGRTLVVRRALKADLWLGVWTASPCRGTCPPDSDVRAEMAQRAHAELGVTLYDVRPAITERPDEPVFTARTPDVPRPSLLAVMDWRWIDWHRFVTLVGAAPWSVTPWDADQVPELHRLQQAAVDV